MERERESERVEIYSYRSIRALACKQNLMASVASSNTIEYESDAIKRGVVRSLNSLNERFEMGMCTHVLIYKISVDYVDTIKILCHLWLHAMLAVLI